jgi:hypothetical protein
MHFLNDREMRFLFKVDRVFLRNAMRESSSLQASLASYLTRWFFAFSHELEIAAAKLQPAQIQLQECPKNKL